MKLIEKDASTLRATGLELGVVARVYGLLRRTFVAQPGSWERSYPYMDRNSNWRGRKLGSGGRTPPGNPGFCVPHETKTPSRQSSLRGKNPPIYIVLNTAFFGIFGPPGGPPLRRGHSTQCVHISCLLRRHAMSRALHATRNDDSIIITPPSSDC